MVVKNLYPIRVDPRGMNAAGLMVYSDVPMDPF